jgi:peptide/nickel transport system ATP-binding protein
MSSLVEIRGLTKHFPVSAGFLFAREVGVVRAVDGVSFDVAAGETLGLVGESGCGKSTTGRLLLRLIEPTAGEVRFAGREVTALGREEMRALRREAQIIFQDPYGALDPRMTVEEIVAEPLIIHGARAGKETRARVAELLGLVGLAPAHAARYPHEFSGGQRQRIGIARALALEPRFLVCDEPVSALDVSVQAQIVNLLQDLQERLGLTYLFIAHDLAVVRHISTRVAVMYLGKIVEIAPKRALYAEPLHPYTRALLASVPVAKPSARRRRAAPLKGDIPSALAPPPGCRFHTRCPYAMDICREEDPAPSTTSGGTTVYCHLHTSGPRLAGAPLAEFAEATI